MKCLTAAAFAAGLAIAGSASAATNYVTNGSFENGTTGWDLVTVGSGTGYSPMVVITTDSVVRSYPDGAFNEGIPADNAAGPFANDGGTKAAYFSSDVGSESLTQLIDLAKGWYEVGFDAYIPQNGYNNANDATFTASIGTYAWEPVQLKGTAIGAQNWKHYSAKVYVSPGQTGVPTSFTFAADGYAAVDVLIDRVYITDAAVPEPATWALMIMGFGSVGAGMRQRRRQAVAA